MALFYNIWIIVFCMTITTAALADNSAKDWITSYFSASSHIGEPKIVPCTLSGGTQTECYNVTFISVPDEHKVGPWCPRNIADGKDAGGIWTSNDRIYNVDGAFIKNLAGFYDDPVWQMYNNGTGAVNVTETAEACAAAARPNVDPAYYNYCVECRLSFMPEKPEITYVFPVNPVKSKRASPLIQSTGVGVALDGIKLEGPAPVRVILGAHTLAPFDPCGGHINLHVGYHYHAAMGCSKEIASQGGHAPMIGIALDGYHIYARLNEAGVEPDDLDLCRGHTSNDIGYHYHVNDPGKNQLIGCFHGEYGCLLNDPDKTCNAASKRGNQPEF
ncbi:MAG: YHYH protein [Candidatus Dadabacteria bacterium]|nr:YHYH protein [Candidatus Dadabacteria bacterium]